MLWVLGFITQRVSAKSELAFEHCRAVQLAWDAVVGKILEGGF